MKKSFRFYKIKFKFRNAKYKFISKLMCFLEKILTVPLELLDRLFRIKKVEQIFVGIAFVVTTILSPLNFLYYKKRKLINSQNWKLGLLEIPFFVIAAIIGKWPLWVGAYIYGVVIGYRCIFDTPDFKKHAKAAKDKLSIKERPHTFEEIPDSSDYILDTPYLFYNMTKSDAKRAYRLLQKKYHPDNGGSEELSIKIQSEYQEYQAGYPELQH